MPRFDNAKDLEKHLKKALDSLQAEVLITTQAKLGSAAVSPVDTGRMRSSWFAAEGASSNEVAPEKENSRSSDATDLKVDANKTYHLTNNLPYVKAVALEGRAKSKGNGKGKGGNWFIDFMNVTVPKIQNAAARVVKQEYEL